MIRLRSASSRKVFGKLWLTKLPTPKSKSLEKNKNRKSQKSHRNPRWRKSLSQWHESEELKELQEKWYKKLKDEGFNDIEDMSSGGEYLKAWHSTYFSSRYTPDSFEMKEDYYRRASHFLYEHKFEWIPGSTLINFKEREAWRLHTEGVSYKQIAVELRARGYKANKDSVNRIISDLKQIMYSMTWENDEYDQ